MSASNSDSDSSTDLSQAPDQALDNQVTHDQTGEGTFWQVLSSTIAAAVGVQSSANRKRDFSRGKASHFIFMGIGFTIFFVLLMVALVSMVLPD